MTEHRLDALLKPASIALVGASERPGSPGRILAQMVIESNFAGAVYPVNPGYEQILGRDCYPGLEAVPEPVEHVVIALGNAHLESALQAAIEHGARAATIYASGVLAEDSEPKLAQRLADTAGAAGIAICGINGMGFYNPLQQLYAGIFPRPGDVLPGGISYIAQSGSAFTALCHNGCRLGFNLCVSAGSEIATGVADYMDWCLQQSETRVIGLFLETVRDSRAFVDALQKARDRDIPVVVLKIGKSPLSAAMAVTHTGAIAGNHAAYEALFRAYGVIEVQDFDEMTAILMLLQSGRHAGSGEFAAIFESGGLRELVTDLADDLGIAFAQLQQTTIDSLQQHLEPGLEAQNPLDAWGSNDNFEARFEACLELLMRDDRVAAGAFISNYRDDYYLSEAIFRVVESVSRKTAKPIALATCYADLAHAGLSRRAYAAGLPLLDGARESLLAFKHLFDYHRGRTKKRTACAEAALDPQCLAAWRDRLQRSSADTLAESEALALLRDFGLPVVDHAILLDVTQLCATAASFGYPLVLKTAEAGFNHKSDNQGVAVGIQSEAELSEVYADFCHRLGPTVLLAQMAEAGVEIGLGSFNDPQFGPILMVAAGGIQIELLADRAVAICPVDAQQAEDMLASLQIDRLLRGLRGRPAGDREALIDIMVVLSQIAFELREQIAEIDINPVIVSPRAALAVDALVLTRKDPC